MRVFDSSTGRELARAETGLLAVVAHGELTLVEADVGGSVSVPAGARAETAKGKRGQWLRVNLDMPFSEWWEWLHGLPTRQ